MPICDSSKINKSYQSPSCNNTKHVCFKIPFFLLHQNLIIRSKSNRVQFTEKWKCTKYERKFKTLKVPQKIWKLLIASYSQKHSSFSVKQDWEILELISVNVWFQSINIKKLRFLAYDSDMTNNEIALGFTCHPTIFRFPGLPTC